MDLKWSETEIKITYLLHDFFFNMTLWHIMEARRPHGYSACLQIKQSRFAPWPDTLCRVLGQDIFSHTASLHPGI